MTSDEIRKRFLAFFEARNHTVIPSASLVPENDPSVLFTTAGMQPLVPYLLGQEHPAGKRLVNVQKCVRTQDIEEVGDATHDTFFEMLGNWSLGDYFKKDAITWSYEFLTSKDEGLGLDPNRLYVTVFEGDEDAPKDEESAEIWKSLGIPEERIYFLGKEDNWWSPGDNGPCGPDSEMFYDLRPEVGPITNKEEFKKADDQSRVVEVWNDVFMEYEKKDGKVTGKLTQQNVDTGAGLERLAMVMQDKDNIFDTDLFAGIMKEVEGLASDTKKQRIIADHVRTAVLLISDGVVPSNTEQGYILRRLLRRAIFNTDNKEIPEESLAAIVGAIVFKYEAVYENMQNTSQFIQVIQKEQEAFKKTLDQGLKQFEKMGSDGISGKEAFTLFTTYGFPLELTQELAQEEGIEVDEEGFKKEMREHQDKSRSGAEGKFKGGLADTNPKTIAYHTATHLLHEALRRVLGDHVHQRGSNITSERLRFDFSHTQKMTDEEKQKVEDMINEIIKKDLPVSFTEMSTGVAFESGALGEFGVKYGDKVKVYSVGEGDDRFSYEICGGPHVESTGAMGTFKIKKEEASSAGVRRIKATLE
ncbi:alanine--tRNA ligase [bacterium]|nr:alanine--tRNA ligase [bacterium]|tara:strand:+ start:3530 stop:5287 length:1758 start_codon:yes stop_codon:yes gene_type:complete